MEDYLGAKLGLALSDKAPTAKSSLHFISSERVQAAF